MRDAPRRPLSASSRTWITVLVATALLLVLVVPVARAGTRTSCRVRNVSQGSEGRSIALMVDAAHDGDRLRVRGRCVGAAVVGVDLHIEGAGERPTLSGADRLRVLEVGPGSTVLLTGLTLEDGAAPFGGGILNHGSLTVRKSTIVHNRAGPRNECGLVPDPTCDYRRRDRNDGGGIVNEGTMLLADSRVRDNEAGDAGGILNLGTLTLRRTTVSRNVAALWGESVGGGIVNGGTLRVDRSTIARNTVISGELYAVGGGIYNSGALTVNDSTISRNLAYGSNGGEGGGIANGSTYVGAPGDVAMTASTVTRNEARNWWRRLQPGSGMTTCPASDCWEAGRFTVRASVIAGNGRDCRGPFTSEGRNLIGVACRGFKAGTGPDQVGTNADPIDPRLGPLDDNGGSTPTHALLPGSPALDRAGRRPCATARDQRGVRRPQGLRCDIGAFERR